ncbi:MAG: hypothetical protein CL840_15425 [Crocinitomicaceae bacterium]|nr:hypothetical protein [Crocinitomicaceae bacterium]|tara:strand:+ start:2069 stop:2251 length:183 start_codon:yes stop_codon:yes gene_type:complete
MSNHFEANHPIDGSDIVVEYDDDGRLVGATYQGDGLDVDISDGVIKNKIQADIDHYLDAE